MNFSILLHVRPAPQGRLIVTPVEFPQLAREGRAVHAVLDPLRKAIEAELRRWHPIARSALVEPEAAELLRVAIEHRPEDGDDPVPLTLGVVVTRRSRGAVVLRFPAFPRLQRVLRSDTPIPEYVQRKAPELLRGWTRTHLLASDEPESSRLEALAVEIPDASPEPARAAPRGESETGTGFLAARAQELTASNTELERFDGRDEIVDVVLADLVGPGRSSVLLVGPPDVGKTALVNEIAARIVAGNVPPALRGRKVWRTSANEIIAGARYTGMWQEQFRHMIDELRATRALCFIGEPNGIVDAGRWSESTNNASRLLRPYIESGELTLILEATPEQVDAARAKEPSFIDAFHRVVVAEPSAATVQEVAQAAAARLTDVSGLEVTVDAVETAKALTGRFEPYRGNPGKVVRLLKETVRSAGDRGGQVDGGDVTRTFARRTGLPLTILSDDIRLDVDQVREHFEGRVLGQPDATAAVVELIIVLKAGLNRPGKPLASLFFIGPTGVGKTELARTLAEFLFGSRDRLLRLDMGEYTSGDALPKLIGSGWKEEDEGELTRRIREQPFSVLLLDEIEKAHASVFDAFLSLLGEGRLTDASGRTANFESAIVIMTSNLGTARGVSPLGFASPTIDRRDRSAHHFIEQTRGFFRPEFFNRIDQFVVFDELDETIVRQIARRELGRLFMREGIVRRKLLVEADEDVVERLAKQGMDPRYGARPLQREIERAVIAPLARLLVGREPEPGSVVRVHLKEDRISIAIEAVREAAPTPSVQVQRRVATEERTLARAVAATREFVARVDAEEAGSHVVALRGEVTALIGKTLDPAFWDDGPAARVTLSRIYQVESVLEKVGGLHHRASGLADMARQVAAARDGERLLEIWSALDEMEGTLALIRLEAAGAIAGAAGKGAIVSVTPVGEVAHGWASQLLDMYCAWADRTARSVVRSSERNLTARIEGLSTFELLRGEAGLHRRVRPDRSVLLARVTVSALEAGASADGIDTGSVVRVYEEGRRQLVRDPRTGRKESKVNAVLRDGMIDDFLLAWVRAQEARPGTAR